MPLPPRDSWIRLAPGKGFALDSAGKHEWSEKTAAMRVTRGSVLALAFEVEHSLDLVIERFFFATGDEKSDELKKLFGELFHIVQGGAYAV